MKNIINRLFYTIQHIISYLFTNVLFSHNKLFINSKNTVYAVQTLIFFNTCKMKRNVLFTQKFVSNNTVLQKILLGK